MAKQIFGIAGAKGHGKDTVAALLGGAVVRFADPLKNMLRAFYRSHYMSNDEIERRIEGDLKEVPCKFLCGKTPRHAMQTLGDEWGRQQIDIDLWINSWRLRADHFEKIVTPDVRYANEALAITAAGGQVIHVDASSRVARNEHSDHASENRLDADLIDIFVRNNGTLDELARQVRELVLR